MPACDSIILYRGVQREGEDPTEISSWTDRRRGCTLVWKASPCGEDLPVTSAGCSQPHGVRAGGVRGCGDARMTAVFPKIRQDQLRRCINMPQGPLLDVSYGISPTEFPMWWKSARKTIGEDARRFRGYPRISGKSARIVADPFRRRFPGISSTSLPPIGKSREIGGHSRRSFSAPISRISRDIGDIGGHPGRSFSDAIVSPGGYNRACEIPASWVWWMGATPLRSTAGVPRE